MSRGFGGPAPHMQAMGQTEKVHLGKSWSRLLGNARKYWGWMIFAVIAAAAGTILTLLGPDRLSDLTDLITKGMMTGIDLDEVKRIGLLLTAFYGASFLLAAAQNYTMASVTQGVTKGLRSSIQKKINVLPMAYFNKVSTGDVLSRVTNDVDTIGQSFNQSIGTLVSAVTLFVGSLVMMLKTNVILTLAAVGATLIGFVLMMVIMGKSQGYFAQQQRDLGSINGHVEEIYAGHMVVKAYNGEKEETERFDEMNESLRRSAFRAQSMSGLMMPLMQLIGNFG